MRNAWEDKHREISRGREGGRERGRKGGREREWVGAGREGEREPGEVR